MKRHLATWHVWAMAWAFCMSGCDCEDGSARPGGPDQGGADMMVGVDMGDEDMGRADMACPAGTLPDGRGGCQTDPCAGHSCALEGEECVAQSGQAMCRCPAGTHADMATGRCVVDQTCTDTSCSGKGRCREDAGVISCMCDTGHTGDRCEACAVGYFVDGQGGCSTDPCAANPCDDTRVCTLQGEQGVCACKPGTHDEQGRCVPDVVCAPASCNEHGTCQEGPDAISCTCTPGWARPFCGTCDADAGYHDDGQGGCTTDPCLPDPCAMNGDPHRTTCVAQGDQPSCQCDAGYHDEGGQCVVDMTCQPDSCSGHGTCADTGGVISCQCQTGYTGADCSACDAVAGYHDDGQGGCTTDPCLPNPCAMNGIPGKSVCASSAGAGSGYVCQCAAGLHDDGQGGCTSDPCLPDLCAAQNKACRVDAMGMAECYTPDCDDQNPCTTDTLVQGACQHADLMDGTSCSTDVCRTGEQCAAGQCVGGAARVCDDQNPCTDDVCVRAQGGCVFTNDDTNVPDDGVGCTVDSCSGGVAAHTADDARCDDGLFCNGQELCAPLAAGANPAGCLTGQSVPQPPADPSPCATHGACDEATQSFPFTQRPVGGACDDGIACTSGDACDAQGRCAGTPTASCSGGGSSTCTSITPFTDAVDVSVAHVTMNMTLNGQPLPATNAYRDADIYLVSRDTNAWHNLVEIYYSSGNLNTRVAKRVVPGVYDVVYATDGTITPYTKVWMSNGSTDAYPAGVRVLQSGVVLAAGNNTLDIDIPVAEVTVNATLGGQPLPATNAYRDADLYLVSKDTNAWHNLLEIYYSSGNLNTRVAKRFVPGTYDIVYSTDGTITPYTKVWMSNGSTDAYPAGLRVLQSDVVLGAGMNALSVDIPVTQLTVNATLGGQPLPATNAYRDADLYLVSRDTNAWHNLLEIYYSSGNLNTRVAKRVVPGTYDIVYSTNGSVEPYTKVWMSTSSSDAYPAGLRVLQSDVQISGATQTLDIDIPVTQLTVNATLGGQPLPATNAYRDADLYLVSRDTNAWHNLLEIYYSSGNLNTRVAKRVVPGTYDIVYSTDGSVEPYTKVWMSTSSSDAYPAGLRVLQSDVQISGATQTLDVDIPVADLTVNATLGGQPLPATNAYRDADLYLVSRDTNAWHNLLEIYYSSGNLNTRVAKRVVPGTYDIVYSTDGSVEPYTKVWMSYGSTDAYPAGLRVVQEGVVVTPGANTISVDIPVSQHTPVATLDGQPLPATNAYRDADLYLVSKDTNAWHNYMEIYYSSGNLNTRSAKRLVPGVYDVVYATDGTITPYTKVWMSYGSTDAYPAGVRVVQQCVMVQ